MGVIHLFVFNSFLVNCGIVVETMSDLVFGGLREREREEEEGVNHLFVFNSILVNCEIVAETVSTFPLEGSVIFFVFNSILVNCGIVAKTMSNFFGGEIIFCTQA